MPVPHYGVWVGKPLRYTSQTAQEDPRSPHTSRGWDWASNLPGRRIRTATLTARAAEGTVRCAKINQR
ncbi:hypothetical protein N7486_003510 [Penicillium sp. IBT 16267x]|nr:hypothetical protein N7486_003510 [Penicillium sp. IBT 16267x]